MGFGFAKNTAVIAVSMSVWQELENQVEGLGELHQLIPISATSLLVKQPLDKRIL